MNYYDLNAEEFFNGTVDADMTIHYDKFLNAVPEKANILDAGCGSGRDTLMFKSLGYDVTSIDGSAEMCRLASEYADHEVLHMQFQDIDFKEEFDGIWASASLLHVPSDELDLVLDNLRDSLKPDGVLYASFKRGDFEGMRNGRYFNDFDETSARELFEDSGFKVLGTWLTHDVRLGREDEKWVNILVQKQS